MDGNGNGYDPGTGTIIGGTVNKWFVPEDRLNPDQRRFLSDVDINRQNIWIKGFAGSGKSILLVHVARKVLATNRNAKIVFIVYTQSLVEMFRTALRELGLSQIPVMTYYAFMNSSSSYDYILCDEVQDLTPRILSAMYRRSSHLVVAGDSNQSIYNEDPRWKESTVNVNQIPGLINGQDFELTIIERLTESLARAVRALTRLNIFGSRRNLTATDTKVSLCKASSTSAEVEYVINNATRVSSRGYTAAILVPTQKKIVEFVNSALESMGKQTWNSTTNDYGKVDFGAMNAHLRSQGVRMQCVGNGYGSFKDNTDYVVLMTYHSSKGLDFDYVYIPYCNSYLWINYDAQKAKTLFMVAMTRARMNLYITYTGSSYHGYVGTFASDCSTRSI